MKEMPLIMVAPNGARRTKKDHPALPVTIDELARTAAECLEAGAGAIHVHVRDKNQRHVLDGELYLAAMAAIRRETAGQMLIQVTTEAVGQYLPHEQREVVRVVMPEAVSIAVAEMVPEQKEEQVSAEFYRFLLDSDIAVQHILYSVEEIRHFADLVAREVIPGDSHSVLFPLGRYSKGQQSDPLSLTGFLNGLADNGLESRCHWAVCAFGKGETRSLAAAMAMGGQVRVGFENSLWHGDGRLAASNAERVENIYRLACEMGLEPQIQR
jgi:uncharacterized protein (DUF849 family)